MSKQTLTIIAAIVALVLASSFLGNIFGQSDKEELSQLIKAGAFLVDVRTPEEFAEGSVAGAVNIPLSEVPNQLKQFEGKKNIIVFCRSGNRSGKAKSILEQNGFTNVFNGATWQQVEAARKNSLKEK